MLAPPFQAFPFLPHCQDWSLQASGTVPHSELDDSALGYHIMAWGITINPHSLGCPSGVLAPLSVTWPRLGLLPFLFGTAIAARGCGAAAGVLAAHRGQALRRQVAAGTTKREHTFRAGTCEVSGRVPEADENLPAPSTAGVREHESIPFHIYCLCLPQG